MAGKKRTTLAWKRPTICITDRQLDVVIGDGRTALKKWNLSPRLFVRGNRLVEIVSQCDPPQIREVSVAGLTELLAQCAFWIGISADGRVRARKPPREVVAAIHARPTGFPKLRGIVETPFVAPGGAIVSEDGYHAGTQLYLACSDHRLRGLKVSTHPTATEVTSAATTLTDLLSEFLYESSTDRDHHVVSLLAPFARPLIKDAAPGYLFDADDIGAGKGLAANLAAVIGTGRECESRSLPKTEPEREYTIGALLRAGYAIVRLDNIRGEVDSPALEAVLTQTTWTARLVGTSDAPSLPNRATWLMTGNGVRMTRDLARRLVPIRLRKRSMHHRYRRPRLLEWARKHRPELVRAALVLIVASVRTRRRGSNRCLGGSFEQWSQRMNRILAVAGLQNALDPAVLDEFRRSATGNQSSDWGRLFRAWRVRLGDSPAPATAIVQALMSDLPVEVSSAKDPAKSLGRYLANRAGKNLGGGYEVQRAGKRGWAMRRKTTTTLPTKPTTSPSKSKAPPGRSVCRVWPGCPPTDAPQHRSSALKGGSPQPPNEANGQFVSDETPSEGTPTRLAYVVADLWSVSPSDGETDGVSGE